MPNWVDHDLEITGPEAELKRFRLDCFSEGEEGPRLDFDKLIPMPTSIKESNRHGQDGSRGDLYGLGSGENFFPDWYVWSVRNWGTKWNAHHTKFMPSENSSNAIKLRFSTAWSIPWPIYEEFAARFPLLTIEGEIIDIQLPFGGHIRCHAGRLDYEDKTKEIEAKMNEFFAQLDERERTNPASPLPATELSDEDIPF